MNIFVANILNKTILVENLNLKKNFKFEHVIYSHIIFYNATELNFVFSKSLLVYSKKAGDSEFIENND